MASSFLRYLAEASFCLAVFALAYRLLLARLTSFTANRAYLLGALAASMVIPLLALPGLAALLAGSGPAASATGPLPFRLSWTAGAMAAPAALTETGPDLTGLVLPGLLGVYLLGALYKLLAATRNLRGLTQLIRRHPRTDLGAFAIVHLPAPGLPAFSFGRHVFLSPLHETLSAEEHRLLLLHEGVHVRQKHTLDLLLTEALGVLFWFNGLLPYFRQQLKTVHEYLADKAVARAQDGPRPYGELLIKLAARQPPFALAHAFSNQQIFLRIKMLTQPTSSPMQKLRFLLVLPVFGFAWAATACTGAPTPDAAATPAATAPAAPPAATSRIGRITWQGNTYLSTAELNEALGLKTGDAYDSAAVAQRLSFAPDGDDLTSRYMDHGYLFFSVSPEATRQPDGTTDLAFTLNEGRKARLRNITMSGTPKTGTAALLRLLPLRTGDDFSRANLMKSQTILAQQSTINPAKIAINPQPVMSPNTPTDFVDIELVVEEK
ncbi:POTRA domain-containing protein [Hymenobacter sp. IS2118]|uniref:POTRA domain-containing protein n=1 Tax=Hymenobacter sp. IS2118 TaxID=1505605 RepID=UPI000558BBB9|nr:POTRA domain-containing protein [Hymenobacter sp. IS2118]